MTTYPTYVLYVDHLKCNLPTKGITIQPLKYKRKKLVRASTQSQITSLNLPQGMLLPEALQDMRSKTEDHFKLQAVDLNAWLSCTAKDSTSVADFVDKQYQSLIEPHIYDKIMGDKTYPWRNAQKQKNR